MIRIAPSIVTLDGACFRELEEAKKKNWRVNETQIPAPKGTSNSVQQQPNSVQQQHRAESKARLGL